MVNFTSTAAQDFLEMFVHHLATISLLVLSWTCHLHRVGSIVLLVHDFADHWLGRHTLQCTFSQNK